MKAPTKPLILSAILIAFGQFISISLFGQKLDNAYSYMEYMDKQYRKVMEDMWDYSSATAHSKSARKIENRRKDLIVTTLKVQQSIAKMPDYNGDKGLRDSAVSFLSLSYYVLTNDFAKIVDMEEIAEQSYDKMEAYLMAQEMADEKLNQASDRLDNEWHDFAKRNNVKVTEGSKDKLSKNMDLANKTFKYYNTVYLVFFKSFKQDYFLSEAIQKQDINAMEQNRNSLLKFAIEGAKKLDTIKGLGGDNSLKVTLKQLLDFYKVEASVKITVITNYYLKKENFEKAKTEFDAKSEFVRTKDDVTQYNKALTEYNKAVADYNRVANEISQKSKLLIDNWNRSVESFLDRHVPKK